ncbi:MAG: DUF1810 domain-containing protein [Firmicutes bacterium]|nr:DUF1810 domain-containing protein [Bacillota bacterium]
MYDLDRFKKAQAWDYDTALAEIRSGYKRSHWIWYIFPQIAGLGSSPTAQHYAIQDLAEAKAYLADPLLRTRLLEITGALLALPSKDATRVMGYPDDLKLRSSMTLFREAAPGETLFQQVLDQYFGGEPDAKTLKILQEKK